MRLGVVGGLAVAAVAAVGALLLLIPRPSPELEVRGLLVDVQSRDIVHVESVTLREDSGTVRVFATSPEVTDNPDQPITASHLRQHLTGGIPVQIRYRDGADGPVAIRIVDADPTPAP